MNYSPAIEQKEYLRAPSITDEPLLVVLLKMFLLLGFVAFAFGCSPATKTASIVSSPGEPATPDSLPVSIKLDQDLGKTLDQLLSSPDFAQGRWGVAVFALKDGKLIYEHGGDQLFTPASNMKIYTTAVAVDLLGPDYRWRTSVYSDSEPDSSGTIRGDVVLYGRGAPDFISANRHDNSNSIEELTKALVERGVKHIQGNVIGDESYFRGDPTGEGWQWNDLQWYFGAEASALTVNANSVEVSITSSPKTSEPPKVTTNDVDGYVQTTNNLITVGQGEPLRIGVKREPTDNNVIVWGQYPAGARGYGASMSVHTPSLWAAKIFLRSLKSHGIVVDGDARYRDSRIAEQNRFDPQGKSELAFVNSKTLGEIVRTTNKLSVNLYAELLLRTLGRERTAMLSADSEVGRERGDDERGTDLVRLWLSKQGIKISNLAIHDGSGLSRLDLVTPRATAQLLEAIRKTNSAKVFTDSLPIAGTDGTLGGRLKATEGRVVAKTGALTYDNSLSGYFTANNGETYAFSVICNDFVGHSGSIRLIDQLMIALTQHLDNGAPALKSTQPKAKQ
jgi:D-alanyl-D-alanine carboxypeptidase/D-alanyl-D-alanine-endopeptidase (penicillin-binding protein 4)